MSLPTKEALRRALGALRRATPPGERERVAGAVATALVALPPLARPVVVGSYLSVRAELPSGPLHEALRGAGHTLAAPDVAPGGRMVFRTLDDAPLQPGLLGIPNPTGREVVPDVLVVPALGWDAAGSRLGTGGGYYDRYLATFTGVAVGVGPEASVVPWVPVEPHDRGVGWLVTEARAQRVGRVVRVAAAVWVRDGRVFAARRPPGVARGGAWELPGGKVEARRVGRRRAAAGAARGARRRRRRRGGGRPRRARVPGGHRPTWWPSAPPPTRDPTRPNTTPSVGSLATSSTAWTGPQPTSRCSRRSRPCCREWGAPARRPPGEL